MPAAAAPEVSLVVVLYGGYLLARRTLAAIAARADVDHEVIVVDNASPDQAGQRLEDEIEGATFILSDRNLGFAAAVNLGVLHARGRLVGLCNADIEPEAGFLSPLVAALDEEPLAAAVTPLYLGAGGEVVEAGGLVGADGRGYGYAVGLSANHDSVAFRREVDYGSAAALLVRRDRFTQVGGLDPLYGLGYYEDADLCFSLRMAGFVTLYEPRSRVRHAGHGSFDRAGRLAQLERNRPLFTSRHQAQLRGRPLLHRPPWDPHADLVVRDWWAPQRLLVIDPDGVLGAFASAVQRLWPRSRVTVLGGDVRGEPRVERHPLDRRLPGWLEQRRFHYGAAVTTAAGADRYGPLLARTQPQATVGVPSSDDPRAVMAGLGYPAPPGW